MKILYIASGTLWGGASVALFNLINELHTHSEIRVVFPLPYGRFCKELDKIGVKYYLLIYGLNIYPQTFHPIHWLKRFAASLYYRKKARKEIEKIINDFNPDIVHTNVGPLNLAERICIKRKIPHVWHIREFQERIHMHFIPTLYYFKNIIQKKGNYNIAISRDIFNHYHLREGIDRVIYDGVFDRRLVKDCSHVNKEDYFLYVGAIEEAKGVTDMLEAFGIYSQGNRKRRLILAGRYFENYYFEQCQTIIKKYKLDNSVFFLGERNDVYDLMQRSSAVIIPSKSEGFGFVTAEAMINNSIVIGRNTTGIKEQLDIGCEITGEEIGLRFETIDDLVDCLKRLDQNDYSEMLVRAKGVAMNNYSTQKHKESVLDYYHYIMSLQKES